MVRHSQPLIQQGQPGYGVSCETPYPSFDSILQRHALSCQLQYADSTRHMNINGAEVHHYTTWRSFERSPELLYQDMRGKIIKYLPTSKAFLQSITSGHITILDRGMVVRILSRAHKGITMLSAGRQRREMVIIWLLPRLTMHHPGDECSGLATQANQATGNTSAH